MNATAEGLNWKAKFKRGDLYRLNDTEFVVVSINRRGLALRKFNRCCQNGELDSKHDCAKQDPL